VVDFVNRWSETTEIAVKRFVGWIGISAGKFFDWQSRYGKVNEHNGRVPRDHWIDEEERRAIIEYHGKIL
jgi:putative transposase